ncbi:hypothetical protein [Hydrocarboniphaga effusa]|uniref:hypothetical protein n=1 Tax=Hydrocarboniphaga effusa TaxID=243629 RepID=UPI003BAB2AEA
MKLMTPAAWALKYFSEESRPAEVTMRRWFREGAVSARKIGGTWYVDEHAWLADGNDLLLKVLNNG